MKRLTYLLILIVLTVVSCQPSSKTPDPVTPINNTDFYLGADLSYVNEMEDCGAQYKNQDGELEDPFLIFENAGTNLIRVRLWHNPTWTNYSNISDVKKTILRAKNSGMSVLLDFHFSDTWADPDSQLIPNEWSSLINDTEALGDVVYNYTYNILSELIAENLKPDIVQLGNEINAMILQDEILEWPINWERNSSLINKAISAVRDVSEDIEVMLHIAQPENGLWWFEQAFQNGIEDFDWIGLSYYPVWSSYGLENLEEPLSILIQTYDKRLMIVETAYPFSLINQDSANNILGASSVIENYPPTQEGQLNYLNSLKNILKNVGAEGLVYWEPAWVSTSCSTQWGVGSHWENAALFDANYKANLALSFYNLDTD